MILETLGKLNAELSKKNLSSERKLITFFMEKISRDLPSAHQDLAILSTGYSSILPLDKKIVNRNLMTNYVQTITNHPVHILNDSGSFSPSALIPFCDLGGNMEIVGTYHSHFPVPVCTAFKKKILNNQVCYTVDVNKFIKETEMNDQSKIGLNLFLDYNEEKQYIDHKREVLVNSSLSMSRNLIKNENKGNINEAMIYFSTLGKYF